jgi:dTMP kinase
LTLVLDLPPAAARERVGSARDRIEDRSDDYQRRVREGFVAAARDCSQGSLVSAYYPAPVVLIDALGDPDAVFAQVRSEVERVLALGPRT